MQNLKYILVGLFISGILFSLLMGALILLTPESLPPDIPLPDFLDTPTVAPSPLSSDTPPPTFLEAGEAVGQPTFTSTPTFIPFTPTATATATFTATPGPGEALRLNGGLVVSGPRSPDEQVRLYDVSLQFIAPSFSEARKLGEKINGKGYGSPTLICGPLSIAILRDAGLIPSAVKPYDFWLLNPDDATGREKLSRVFPKNQYTDTRIRARIDQFDWKSQPLQPGDFVYIYAGNGGNFEHMLVVNRVDSAGRAYSVTNYNTPEGFVIKEVMLYDPTDSNAGVFHEWTARQFALLGSTGFGGFEIWRLIPTEPTPLP